MASAVSVRYQVEHVLARKHPAALRLVPRVVRPVYGTGVAMVDALLEGGLPMGAISEITGPACSGRVSLAISFVAGQTRRGQVCAWVDCADGFDPGSAESSDVAMERLLWVRCGKEASLSTMRGPEIGGSTYAVDQTRDTGTVLGGMHPRTETHGLANALGDWLLSSPVRDSVRMTGKPGTPGAINRTLSVAGQPRSANQVQVATDRVPARRGEHALAQKSRLAAGDSGVILADNPAGTSVSHVTSDVAGIDQSEDHGQAGSLAERAEDYARMAPRCAETQQGLHKARKPQVCALPTATVQEAAVCAEAPSVARTERTEQIEQFGETAAKSEAEQHSSPRRATQWDRMDQMIRTTDLLLQGSGFGCIVMDLSGVDARLAHRIPMATWFRFRAAADRTRTSLLVLTRHPCTGSSGEVLLRLCAGTPGGTTVMEGIPVTVEVARQRFTGYPGSRGMEKIVSIRKPPRAATETEWWAPCASRKAAGMGKAAGVQA